MSVKLNSNSPKISVLMSVYNNSKLLREAVDSILGQTFSNFEFIIINDASTDKSVEILRDYAKKDKRIVLVDNETNIGLTKSLNRGLQIAKGQYIARMDADDISELNRFSLQVDFLDSNPDIGLLGTHAQSINEKGEKFGIWETLENDAEIKELLKKRNCFCHGSTMFRAECIKNFGNYREEFKFTQDYDLWLRISEKYKVANLGKNLFNFRKSPNSISGSRLSQQLDYQLLAIELAKERQAKGYDSLDTLVMDNVEQVLYQKYKLKPSDVKKYKSEIYLFYFSKSLEYKYPIAALQLWVKAFMFKPQVRKIKFLVRSFCKLQR